jgi:hypothetical protein
MSGAVGWPSTGAGFFSPNIESLSSLTEEALLAAAELAFSTARRSFSRRVSRPRLWQYQKTKRRTKIGSVSGWTQKEHTGQPTEYSQTHEQIGARGQSGESEFQEIEDAAQRSRHGTLGSN